MSTTSIATRAVRDRSVGVLVGSASVGLMLLVGMAAYSQIDLSVYTSIPEAFRSIMGVPADADAATLAYNVMMGTIAALTYAGLAVSIGASAIAGEERDGTIGLLLANPTSRTGVLAAKVVGLVTLIGAAGLLLWGAAAVTPALLGVGIGSTHIGSMSLHVTVNALFYGFLALAIGSWTGRRGLASAVPASLLTLSFVLVGVLPLIESTQRLVDFIPWYYFDRSEPLRNGIAWDDLGVLVVGIAILAAVAVVGVRRRDLRSRELGTSLLDRLRADPRTQRVAERLAGGTRVSSIAAKTAADHQGLLAVIAVLMFTMMGLLMGVMYAAMESQLVTLADSIPEEMLAFVGGGDMSTPEGFFQAEVLGMMAPIAVITVAVVVGARALAGEEHAGTMGLLLANPVPRRRVLAEKGLVMGGFVVVVGVATVAGIAGGSLLGGLDMDMGNIGATGVMLVLLGLVFGGLALLLGAVTGRVVVATYGTVGVALAAYVLDVSAAVNPAWDRWALASPFHHYGANDPLVNGVPWGNAAVLLVIAVVLVAAALPAFDRRDLRQR